MTRTAPEAGVNEAGSILAGLVINLLGLASVKPISRDKSLLKYRKVFCDSADYPAGPV